MQRKENLLLFVKGLYVFLLVIAVAVCLWKCVGGRFASCGRRIYDGGDFYYTILDDNVIIRGLTAQGKEKEVIFVPEEIKGYPASFACRGRFWGRPLNDYPWKSNKLKKVYLPALNKITNTFSACEKLQRLIVYTDKAGMYDEDNNRERTIKAFKKSYLFDPEKNEASNVSYVVSKNGIPLFYANVSFMYNYETEENYGYYWIDDFDYGSTIDYVPPFPTRAGYTFGGWYRESECVTLWDFENDTLPEEIKLEVPEGQEYRSIKYQETRLYAKWIKQ